MITVVIAAKPEQAEIKAISAARNLNYPTEKLEILVARGRQPSAQRNMAARSAKGEFIYFLDDDSRPFPGNLKKAVAHFASPEVIMVGGPNICPSDAPKLLQAFALTMGSKLAFGPSAARYRPIGKARSSGEKELILCNLLVRKEIFLKLGGFDEKLYPNEENAFMDEIQEQGGRLLYDPEIVVYRHPRSTLNAFCKMLMTYGRGRAEQFRLKPTLGSAPNFVPPLFCIFLLALPFLPALSLWVLALYFALVFVQAVVLVPLRKLLWIPGLMALIFFSHVLYGLGFWRGCFTKPKPPVKAVVSEIKVERM